MALLVHPETPRVVVACGCTLGEEVTWDPRSKTLTWVDIEAPAIWRHRSETGETTRLPVDEKVSFALPTIEPETVLAGFRSGLFRLDLSSGARTLLVRPEPYPAGNRLNSGCVGPDGALYFGTMDDAEASPTGSFHRWDGSRLETLDSQALVTNGPVPNGDGTRLYTVDTSGGTIRVHTLADGRVGPGESLIRFEAGWGKPDGLTLDADDHLWVCHYGGARITRFTPDGAIDRILPMPAPRVTKCAFGGPDLTTLYITTALRGADPTLEPTGGHLFCVETHIRGRAPILAGAKLLG